MERVDVLVEFLVAVVGLLTEFGEFAEEPSVAAWGVAVGDYLGSEE